MNSEILLTCILSSTVAVTVITSIKELILWRLNRKAKVEDDEKEGEEDNLKKILNEHQELLDKSIDAIGKIQAKLDIAAESDKVILRDKIIYLINKYLDLGEITLQEKQAVHHMWNIYHFQLNGNGDLDDLMEMLDEIPVVSHHSHKVF